MVDIFGELDKEFHFTLDAAADAVNHRCAIYFTKEQNALLQDWGQHTVWLNPPSADRNYPAWIFKCFAAASKGATVVALLRMECNSGWFASILEKAQIRYLEIPAGQTFACAECGKPLQLFVAIFHPEGETNAAAT